MYPKQLLAFLLFFSTSLNLYAQPDSLWTRSLGGPGNEVAGTMSVNNLGNNMASVAIDKLDGGIYVTTYSPQQGGFVTNNFGLDDIWVLKLDKQTGDTLWTKVLGGASTERSYKIRAVSTGGCMVVGNTQSSTGVFSTNHGQTDGFIARLDAIGNILWSRCYGGTAQDYLYDIAENPAGNFVACGETGSNDGDLAGTGIGLAWVIYINGNTGIPSQSIAPLGPNSGSANFLENFTIITRLADGTGYLCSGFTSPDFSNLNLDDIWVAKINFNGVVIWSKKYGSTNFRDGSGAILDDGNGSFYIAGVLGGNGGYSNYLGGNGDSFLLKCNSATGDTIWTKNYGGTDWEYFNDGFIDNAGDLYLAGFSRSTNGLLTNQPAYGIADYWMLKLNNNGDTIYTKKIGGNDFDAATGIAGSGLPDDFTICGRSNSNTDWVWGNNGGRDLYVARFFNLTTSLNERNNQVKITTSPNPFNNEFNLRFVSEINTKAIVSIFDITGKIIYNEMAYASTGNNQLAINLSNLSAGFYVLKLSMNEQNSQIKILKK